MTVECTISKGSGWARCPDDWHKRDPGLEAATAGTVAGGLVRLVAEYREGKRFFSRSRSTVSINPKSFNLGYASAAYPSTKVARKVLLRLFREYPNLTAEAWPQTDLSSDDAIVAVLDEFKGFTGTKLSPTQQLFVDGWSRASKTAQGQLIYTEVLFDMIVKDALKVMKDNGWTKNRTLAALVRLRNSSGTTMRKLGRQTGSEEVAREKGLNEYLRAKSSHDNDVEAIRTWAIFDGDMEHIPTAADLDYSVYRTTLDGEDNPGPYVPPRVSQDPPAPVVSSSGGGGGAMIVGAVLVLGGGYLAYRYFGGKRG